jgi:hexokinase
MQGFEKMVSGIYLGEIARLVLHRMALESDFFGDAADNLCTPFTLRYLKLAMLCFLSPNFVLWRREPS